MKNRKRRKPAYKEAYGTFVHKTGRIEFDFTGVNFFVNRRTKPIGSFSWSELDKLVMKHGSKFMDPHGRGKCRLPLLAMTEAA